MSFALIIIISIIVLVVIVLILYYGCYINKYIPTSWAKSGCKETMRGVHGNIDDPPVSMIRGKLFNPSTYI